MDTAKSLMLRRYTLVPETAREFLREIFPMVIESRSEAGFAVENAWVDEEKTEFTWLMSFRGSSVELLAADEQWNASEGRHRIFAARPKYVLAAYISIVEDIL
jgi:hypothetical protein